MRVHSLLLRHDPEGRRHLLRMLDCFYFREHLFIVTELLNSSLLAHYMHLQSLGKRQAYYNAHTLGMLSAQVLDWLLSSATESRREPRAAECRRVPPSAAECHRVPLSAAECRRAPPSAAECRRVPPSAAECRRVQPIGTRIATARARHRVALTATDCHTVRILTSQILDALDFLHSISITHCDIKTPNICLVDAGARQFKLIDFGAAVLTHDVHTSYLQSRWYRAPEVMLGCPWCEKIDLWSLGCVLAEVTVGCALYQYNSIELVLAAQKATRGPFPDWMLSKHPIAQMFFSPSGSVYEVDPHRMPQGTYLIRSAQESDLRTLMKSMLEPDVFGDVDGFIAALEQLLTIDPNARPGTAECLRSPFVAPHHAADRLAVNTTPTQAAEMLAAATLFES